MQTRIKQCEAQWAPAGVIRMDYISPADGYPDWALAWAADGDDWVVHLHGHGSAGDQIFTRQDIRDLWLPHYRELGLGVLSPNLRGNAWMCPRAAEDLHDLLQWTREEFGAKRFFLVSGSMGGTSNLIYAALHPEDITAVSARCPATDMTSYYRWLARNPGDTRDEILSAITETYGGSPRETPAPYAAHSAVANAARLTMPILIIHGDADALIPVEQSRQLVEAMGDAPNLTYIEIPGGDHDAPLHSPEARAWLEAQVQ